MKNVSVRVEIKFVNLMFVKIQLTKELAQNTHVQIKLKTVIIDSNKIKLMVYMLQLFHIKEKDYSAKTLLKKDSL